MLWRWQPLDEKGGAVAAPDAQSFSNQSDAESWLGEHWRELAAEGASSVTLLEGDRTEYTMSLEAG